MAISTRGFKPEIMIIGGSEIYNSTIKYADRLYVTRIEDSFEGDTFFPMFDEKNWKEVERKNSQEKTDIPYFFQVLERI